MADKNSQNKTINKGRFVKGVTPWNKGCKMTKDKKELMKKKVYSKRKGKNNKEIYGEEKAHQIRINQIKSFTKERRKKIIQTRLGKPLSKQHRINIGLANVGREVSDKTKEKIRNKLIDRQVSEETRHKISVAKKGIKRSKDSIEKQAKTLKYQYSHGLRKSGMSGKKFSMEQRQARSNNLKEQYRNGKRKPIRMFGKDNPFYGKTHPPHIIEKIKMGSIGRKHSPEEIAKRVRYGEYSSNWRGGIMFEPYDKSFNLKFKRAIRKRDNQVCMLCGIHREKYWKSFDVHHINYDKLMSIPQNCISLCNSCHVKTSYNREHWTKFFQSLLHEKYNYNYSEKIPIIEFNLNRETKI